MRHTLTIPNLAMATDDEIDALFLSFDGRWSRQTKALMARHGVERLNLDSNWASVPRSWICEGCGRSKPDIARPSDAGVLLCRLDWHHDHLRDYAKRVLRDPANRPDDIEAARRWFGATDICKGVVERFWPAFVCTDCNTADGDAKRRLTGVVHPDFSFSPTEIARFITLRPGLSHEVDPEQARAVWKAVEDDVADRIAFVDVLARRVAEGRHQRHGRGHHFEDPMRQMLRDLSRGDADVDLALARLPQDLLERSVQDDGFRSSLKPKTAKVKTPTQADLIAYTATVDPKLPWVWHDPDWRCPACRRSRFECLRASGAGKWTGKLHRLWVYDPETDPEALYRRNGGYEGWTTYRAHDLIYLCQDCRLIITDTNKGQSHASEDGLRTSDLQRLVGEATAHVRPVADPVQAAALFDANFEHIEAAKAYWDHRNCALGIAVELEIRKVQGVPRDEIKLLLLDRLARPDLAEAEQEPTLEFMLSEAKRFRQADKAARERYLARSDVGEMT